ncbi:MAG: hypothetical protein GXO90_00140 [FCB group bacterium]|nr:hypothetical protein [FCB group bacterium]
MIFRTCRILSVGLLLPLWIHAQTEARKPTTESAIDIPPKTLRFGIIRGLTGAYQVPTSTSNACRYEFNLSANYRSGNNTENRGIQNPGDTTETTRGHNYNRQDYSVSFSSQWIHSFSRRPSAIVYVGFGPSISYSYFDNGSKYTNAKNGVSQQKNNRKQYGLGIKGLIGLDKALTPSISLFLEHQLTFEYRWLSEENSSRAYGPDPIEEHRYFNDITGNFIYASLSSLHIGISVQL